MLESRLWSYLDQCGLEFRLTKAELISKYGEVLEWSLVNRCDLASTKPFIDKLAHPVCFKYTSVESLLGPPESLYGYIRTFDEPEKNYQIAADQITALFGEGTNNSVSNTIARRWDFGRASIEVFALPIHLNKVYGTNEYHNSVKGSKTECTVIVNTTWKPHLSVSQLEILNGYLVFFNGSTGSDTSTTNFGISHALPENFEYSSPNFGFNADQTFLVQITSLKTVNLLPVPWMIEVNCHNSQPAKGAGGAYLSVKYLEQEKEHKTIQNLRLAENPGQPHALDQIAKSLAVKLNLPLNFTEDFDC